VVKLAKPIYFIMKSLQLFSVLALSGLLFFSSCDDNLFDITETITFKHEFVVNSPDVSYAETMVIDLSEDNELIGKYGSKIKDIEVESIRYWLKAHNGSATQAVTRLSVKIGNADATDAKSLINLQNSVLSQMVNNPAFLDINVEGVMKLENQATNAPHSFSYLINVEGNEVPYDFTLVVEVKAKMTANPLN
jgi:hypothetical protein